MIASVQGILLKKTPGMVMVSISGLGLALEIPLGTYAGLPDTGQEVFLLTHMLVREDAIRLFGFQTEAELGLFKILLEINRIGPKLALAILSGISPSDLRKAALQQDTRLLASIPGIGKKSAERILFEITDKLDKLGALKDSGHPPGTPQIQGPMDEVVGVMINLGYRQKDAERVVEELLKADDSPQSVDDLIRAALKKLAGR